MSAFRSLPRTKAPCFNLFPNILGPSSCFSQSLLVHFIPKTKQLSLSPCQSQGVSRGYSDMSTSQVKLSLENPGVFQLPSVNGEAAAKASEILQENHDSHHIFFNQSGFHSTFPPELYFSGFTVTSTGQYASILMILIRSHCSSHSYNLRSWSFSFRDTEALQ